LSRIPTRADGTPFVMPEDTPSVLMSIPARTTPSAAFVISLSIIIGLIIGLGTIVGVLGNAFWVTRNEYIKESLINAQETATLKNTLNRVELTMTRQEAAFEKLSDVVQAIKIDMARRR